MPVKPLGRCTFPLCVSRAVEHGRCAAHPRPVWEHKPGAKRAGLYTRDQRLIRARVLREQPTCARCQRRQSSEVDHVLPIAAGGHRTQRANLQGLCHDCHVIKTAEDRALLREMREQRQRDVESL